MSPPDKRPDKKYLRFLKGTGKHPKIRIKGSDFTQGTRAIIRQRQLLEAAIYEEMEEDYDWRELSRRWWPQKEARSGHHRDTSELIFDPYREFRRWMVKDED